MKDKYISSICSHGYVVIAIASVVIIICGCASSSDSVPSRALNDFSNTYAGKVEAALKAKMSPNGDLVVADAADRDLIINQLLLLIDYNYYQIEANAQRNKSLTDFAGSVISTGFGTAGAIAGGGTAQIMSALIAALEATKTSVDKDLLRGQTITAIVAKMRELRATKLVAIRQAMAKNDLVAYPMSQALIDLLEYYNAGTFLGALQSITEQSAAETVNAKAALDQGVRKLPSIDDLLKKK